jgi:hypothetical protein
MKGQGSKLARQKDEAIAALLEPPTVAAAARILGISDQTLGRWMTRSSMRLVVPPGRPTTGKPWRVCHGERLAMWHRIAISWPIPKSGHLRGLRPPNSLSEKRQLRSV